MLAGQNSSAIGSLVDTNVAALYGLTDVLDCYCSLGVNSAIVSAGQRNCISLEISNYSRQVNERIRAGDTVGIIHDGGDIRICKV